MIFKDEQVRVAMGPDLQFQVELRGFEPLTPSMRTRVKRAAGWRRA
jgi:hypothetical protein